MEAAKISLMDRAPPHLPPALSLFPLLPSSRPVILFTGILVSYKASSKHLGLVYIGQLELEGTTMEGEASNAIIHETASYHDDLLQLIIDACDDAVPAPLRHNEPYPRKLVEHAKRHVKSLGSLAHQLHQALQAGVVQGQEAGTRDQHPQHTEHTRCHVATHTDRAPTSISLLP